MNVEPASLPMNPVDIEELKLGNIKLPCLIDLMRDNIKKASLAPNGINWLVEDEKGRVFLLSAISQSRLGVNSVYLEDLPEITIYENKA